LDSITFFLSRCIDNALYFYSFPLDHRETVLLIIMKKTVF
jgi:hypothetical protein